MELRVDWCFVFVCFSFSVLSSGQSLSNFSVDSLNSLIRDCAFRELIHKHTGVLYKVPLPANLSGVEASVVRLRSGSFWSRGANFSTFRIPPRTIPVPYVRRLVIVYRNLGNRSSSYYNAPGYSLVAPVIGFLAYDASNTSSNSIMELNLQVTGEPVSVRFPEVSLPRELNSTRKCARFGRDGSVYIDEMASMNECSTTSTGHFAIVVPSMVPGPSVPAKGRKERRWMVWVIACGGIIGLVLVGLVGIGIFKLVKNKKMDDMVRQSEEGDALETVWVGRSKMPSATMIRTQPVIENGGAA